MVTVEVVGLAGDDVSSDASTLTSSLRRALDLEIGRRAARERTAALARNAPVMLPAEVRRHGVDALPVAADDELALRLAGRPDVGDRDRAAGRRDACQVALGQLRGAPSDR